LPEGRSHLAVYAVTLHSLESNQLPAGDSRTRLRFNPVAYPTDKYLYSSYFKTMFRIPAARAV